jgi:hypothetical protein
VLEFFLLVVIVLRIVTILLLQVVVVVTATKFSSCEGLIYYINPLVPEFLAHHVYKM